jgi:hypothetical protein
MQDDQLKAVLYELRQLRAAVLVLAAVIGGPSVAGWEIDSSLAPLSGRAAQLADQLEGAR